MNSILATITLTESKKYQKLDFAAFKQKLSYALNCQGLNIFSTEKSLLKQLGEIEPSNSLLIAIRMQLNDSDLIILRRTILDLLGLHRSAEIEIYRAITEEELLENKSSSEEAKKQLLTSSQNLMTSTPQRLDIEAQTTQERRERSNMRIGARTEIPYSEEQKQTLDPKNFLFPPKCKKSSLRVNQIFRNKFNQMNFKMDHNKSNLVFRRILKNFNYAD